MNLPALASLPDEALVPVGWIREQLRKVPAEADDDGPGLTVEAYADLCGRARSTVRNWCASGRIPGAFKLAGKEWRVPRAALASVGPTAPAPQSPCERLGVPAGGLSAWRAMEAEQ